MDTDARTILEGCRLLASVSGDQRERLVAMAEVRRYERGTMIFRQGDAPPGVFIVGAGLVRVFLVSPSGKQHVLHLVSPGLTFAEVAAIGDFPCPAFAEAASDATCLLLPERPFQAALREDHALCLQLLGSFAMWVRHFVGLVEDITLRDAAGRVARFLLEAAGPDGVVRLPSLKKDMASRLNLTSETLSRTLRRLTDEGLIGSPAGTGAEIRLLDRDQLGRVSDGLGPNL
ncbi:Anaerobic regulatory protein [Aquisphaera giovannonii]|uniref:Anaerobic regulatory protein n=1 Tax=Aquisphaera giovannonii TaxID=406548 RepID=A0A5B9VV25_9BACT|nr:Crp/Fnr family transcriptional regulator [Aquisphaera giovannonii]QEH31585.1 Anaerobic regulatory protein [Aquisphaera giovannonii]